jgi:hypothetical protein
VTKELNGVGWRAQSPRYGRNDMFTVFYDNGEWCNDICEGHIDTLMAALKAWKKSKRKPEWAVRFKHKVSRLEGWFQGCAWGASTGSKDQRLKYQDRAAAMSDLWWLRAQGHTAKLVRIK